MTQTTDTLKAVADNTWEKPTEKELRQELERVEARTQQVQDIRSNIKTPMKITVQDYKNRSKPLQTDTVLNPPPKGEVQNLPCLLVKSEKSTTTAHTQEDSPPHTKACITSHAEESPTPNTSTKNRGTDLPSS